jgi:hypothetical protein
MHVIKMHICTALRRYPTTSGLMATICKSVWPSPCGICAWNDGTQPFLSDIKIEEILSKINFPGNILIENILS